MFVVILVIVVFLAIIYFLTPLKYAIKSNKEVSKNANEKYRHGHSENFCKKNNYICKSAKFDSLYMHALMKNEYSCSCKRGFCLFDRFDNIDDINRFLENEKKNNGHDCEKK